MMAAPADNLTALLALRDSLNASIDALSALSPEERTQPPKVNQVRQQICSTATRIASETVNASQEATRIAFMPWLNAVVRTALELDLFNLLGQSTTASELAQKTGADVTLIVRLMRVLTGFHIVAELGEETYAATPVSRALTMPATADLNKHIFDSSWGCIGKMPAYLADLGYKNPDQPDKTLSHYATGTDFFAYLRNDPGRLARFNSAMKGAATLLNSPVPSSLVESGAGESGVVMVDIGGGHGQVTQKVMEENPHLKGRFVVQDLGAIIDEARARNPQYEVMEYDFFTPQPIHGARIYFMRRVLHDFPDSKCREILTNQIHGMVGGQSKLLVCETVLPAVGCSGFESLADISRTTFSSMQRSEKQWTALLASVGLKVVKIWPPKGGPFSVIESELQ
ncbi:Demethylsterigmatocystin 6-O-methyltransferase [Fonsecaea pedrosoi]|nr:Demethylsterigmatocystin 6-O-methyltransferase [Fonsecaea pedrosoi]